MDDDPSQHWAAVNVGTYNDAYCRQHDGMMGTRSLRAWLQSSDVMIRTYGVSNVSTQQANPQSSISTRSERGPEDVDCAVKLASVGLVVVEWAH